MSSLFTNVNGEFITMRMPVAILVTKINIVSASYHKTQSTLTNAPRLYAIYGRMHDTGTWNKIVEETLNIGHYNQPYEYDFMGETFSYPNKMYGKIITSPLTGTAIYNTFALVVNKILGGQTLILGKLELFDTININQSIPTSLTELTNYVSTLSSQFEIHTDGKIKLIDAAYLVDTNTQHTSISLLTILSNQFSVDSGKVILNDAAYLVDTDTVYTDAMVATTVVNILGANLGLNSSTGKIDATGSGSTNTDGTTALSIWNKGTGANIDNVYHLQTGNVGIGVSNDTELTHKLVVNGETKLNDDVLLKGQLTIKKKMQHLGLIVLMIVMKQQSKKQRIFIYLKRAMFLL